MFKITLQDQTFDKIDFSVEPLKVGEYSNCVFNNCNLAEAKLSHFVFEDCTFEACNMAMTKTAGTSFKEVSFKNCKLLGLNFGECNTFLLSLSFTDCILNLASFYKLKLKGTTFVNCSLQEADFVEADLPAVVFQNCNLANAVFENTILEKADFRTAENYSFDPERNKIKKARFSRQGVLGLLSKYQILID
jgi:fluoroquinolone resistance protein